MSSRGGAAAGGGGSGRVSIPTNVRKTIQNIKEITGNHSEEDIYAMLKECSMDPNETTNKLLLLDTFHEVKRKRDRRKENMNKELAEPRWKTGMQGRGNRGGRGASSSRNISHDAGGGTGRNLASGKENGSSQVLEKSVNMPSSITAQETKSKEAISAASFSAAIVNSPTVVALGNMAVTPDSQAFADSDAGKPEGLLAPVESKKNPVVVPRSEDQSRQQGSGTSNSFIVHSSGAYFSASDPILLPSQDSWHPNAVGTIRREVRSKHHNVWQIPSNSDKNKSITETTDSGSSIVQGKLSSKVHIVGKNHHLESSQSAPSVHASSSVSRPSSNYNNRSQVIGAQKVGPSKEWKPKSTNPKPSQGPGMAASSDAPSVVIEANAQLQPTSNSLDPKEANVELQEKLEELHISDGQYVIIPNHLHVPEAEKLGFCFGSFDTSFGINTSNNITPKSDQSISETTDGNEEAAGKHFSSNENAFVTEEVDYPDNNQSASYVPELSSNEDGVASSTAAEYNEPKQETAPRDNQYSVAHTSPGYSFGFMPQIIGNQLAPIEGSESQVRDVSRNQTFVVQQPLDPTSYYAQFYRSGADGDGRISPFHSAGFATKYNGNLSVVSPQTSQSAQEGSQLGLSTVAPTPIATHAGVLQNSIAATQQTLNVFRPPTGLHLSQYPTNYIPYGPYFPPFLFQPPAMPQFLSNGAFPQQPQGGSVYPPAAAAKYPLTQFKPGTHMNSSSHIGLPDSYGPYGSSLGTATGNSASNEDLAASHFKESNAYASGQQSEGSGVWLAQSGQDMSGLQASSFYNLPQGQMAFSPAQPGHGGPYPGVYHPGPVNVASIHPLLQQSQAITGPVNMVGPTAGVYQQPQHPQINWPAGNF